MKGIKIGRKGAKIGMMICWLGLAFCLYAPELSQSNIGIAAVALAVLDTVIPYVFIFSEGSFDDII